MNKDASLDRYIERVREIPKLSREDEHALAVAARDGDRAAADRIVEANLRYVVAVALQYRRYGIRLGDLIAEGNVGLMTAIRKFDPDRGTRFVTYAGYWIRAFVLEAVVRSASMVGGGSGPLRSKLFFRLRRERARLANAVTDQTELVEKMAERFDMSPTKMERMLQRLDGKDVSLDATLYDDAGRTLLDQLEGTVEPQDEHLARRERRAQLAGEMKRALRVLDLPTPEPGLEQARVRIHSAGVCHSDLHIVRGDWAGVPDTMPVGHEAIGTVEALAALNRWR